MYTFNEDSGLVKLELILGTPIACCPVSVRIKVEDINANGKQPTVLIFRTSMTLKL